MPRRKNPFSNLGGRRSRQGNKGPRSPFASAFTGAAPPPISAPAQTADVESLKEAYSWMPVSKELAFKMVIEWFATNTPFLLFKDPLDADRQKAYDRAMASVKLAESTHAYEERDTAYRTALRLLNTKVWPNKGLMTLQEGEAITEPSEKVKQVQTVLGTLNTVFDGKVSFRMTLLPNRQFLKGEVLLPKTEIESLIPKTPLQIVLNEVVTVAKVMSIESTPDGDKLNGQKFMETLPVLNSEIATWVMTDKTLANKTIGKAPAIHTPRATSYDPNAPKAPRAASSGIRFNDHSTVTVLIPGFVPSCGGNRKKAMEIVFGSATIGAAKTALGPLKGMVGWATKQLVDAGAIEVK